MYSLIIDMTPIKFNYINESVSILTMQVATNSISNPGEVDYESAVVRLLTFNFDSVAGYGSSVSTNKWVQTDLINQYVLAMGQINNTMMIMKVNVDTMASPDHMVVNGEILGYYSTTDMMDIKADPNYGEYAWYLTTQATNGFISRFNISSLVPDHISKIYYEFFRKSNKFIIID